MPTRSAAPLSLSPLCAQKVVGKAAHSTVASQVPGPRCCAAVRQARHSLVYLFGGSIFGFSSFVENFFSFLVSKATKGTSILRTYAPLRETTTVIHESLCTIEAITSW